MNKAILDKALKEKMALNEKIFVPYIMAGDGGLDILEERLNFLQEAGATAVELGVPFSDPVADGPVIQEAGKRALAHNVTLTAILNVLESFKERRTIPVVLMTYFNPIFKYGMEAFVEKCNKAGISGVIIPDLPLEEEATIAALLKDYKIAFIRLAALTSPMTRLKGIASRTEGFLYAVTVKGITGPRNTYEPEVGNYLEQLKQFTNTPVLAGFGVSNADQARELSEHCDGVIVGSKIVDLLHQKEYDAITTLIQDSNKKRNTSYDEAESR